MQSKGGTMGDFHRFSHNSVTECHFSWSKSFQKFQENGPKKWCSESIFAGSRKIFKTRKLYFSTGVPLGVTPCARTGAPGATK